MGITPITVRNQQKLYLDVEKHVYQPSSNIEKIKTPITNWKKQCHLYTKAPKNL